MNRFIESASHRRLVPVQMRWREVRWSLSISAGNLLSCMMEACITSEVVGRFDLQDVLSMMA